MSGHRRVCPACGSVATEAADTGWRCTRCGHTARRFVEAHAQVDHDRSTSLRTPIAGGGYMRRSPLIADD